jgi:hypothetical protein
MALLLSNHAADILIGIQLASDRGAVIRHAANKLIRLMFLIGEDQNDGSIIRIDAVLKRARKRPTHIAVLSAFQFDLEKGATAIPVTNHVTRYSIEVSRSSKPSKLVCRRELPKRRNHTILNGSG